jgi:hypothetical protein
MFKLFLILYENLLLNKTIVIAYNDILNQVKEDKKKKYIITSTT